MKKLLVLILLVISLGYAEAKKIKGFIIYGSDTVEVTFKISVGLFATAPSFERMQYKVIYYDANGKRLVLRPDMAKEIRFSFKGKEYRMLSRSAAGIDFAVHSNLFLKLEVDGEVKLFSFFSTRTSGGNFGATAGGMHTAPVTTYTVERYLLQKRNGILKRPKTLTFRKDMKEYFSECPELCDKIENKEFRKDELFSIVEFYNRHCQ